MFLMMTMSIADDDDDGDEEGADQAASSLLLRWACRLSAALHRENARNVRRALGENLRLERDELAAEHAG